MGNSQGDRAGAHPGLDPGETDNTDTWSGPSVALRRALRRTDAHWDETPKGEDGTAGETGHTRQSIRLIWSGNGPFMRLFSTAYRKTWLFSIFVN